MIKGKLASLTRTTIVIIAALTVLAACQSPSKSNFSPVWIDLTYSFDSTTLYWPNNPSGFQHILDKKGVMPMGFYYSSYSLRAPEHGGTHIDAPIHFAENHLTADKIPLDHLTGNACVIDVSKEALSNRDYQISKEDIQKWENTNGQISSDEMVLFRTGYGQFYPDREKYFGTIMRGEEAIPGLHFPGISPEAAQYLADKKVKAVGLDTPSLDYGQSEDFKAHQVLLGSNIPGFENVAHLDQLPLRGAYIVALPMKIGQGSGAPLRIIASIGQFASN